MVVLTDRTLARLYFLNDRFTKNCGVPKYRQNSAFFALTPFRKSFILTQLYLGWFFVLQVGITSGCGRTAEDVQCVRVIIRIKLQGHGIFIWVKT